MCHTAAGGRSIGGNMDTLYLRVTLSLISLCVATGDVDFKNLYKETGSSVTFYLGATDNYSVSDLKFGGTLVMNNHYGHRVFEPYTQRGRYNPSDGSFLLTNLTEKDSGSYWHVVNFTRREQINLLVFAPVRTPNMTIHVKEELDRCLVILECHVQGDGPLNITFRRDQAMVTWNISKSENMSALILDGWDPTSAGRYSCNVENPVSDRFTVIDLAPAATQAQTIMASIAAGSLFFWTLARLYDILVCVWASCTTENSKGSRRQQNRGIRAFILTFTSAAILLGFFNEAAAVYISWTGDFLSRWWFVLPAFFLLCRAIVYIQVIRGWKDAGCDRFMSVELGPSLALSAWLRKGKEIFCSPESLLTLAINISSLIGVPIFYIYVLYVYIKRNSSPCGSSAGWMFIFPFLAVLSLLALLFLISYIWFDKKEGGVCGQNGNKSTTREKLQREDSNEHLQPERRIQAQNYNQLAAAEDNEALPIQIEANG